jgi:hypothetical protein
MNVLHDLEHTLRSVGSLTREAFVTYIPSRQDKPEKGGDLT